MVRSSSRYAPGRFGVLDTLLSWRPLGSAGASPPKGRRRFQPRMEVLEERSAPAVSILNGGGLGYAGNGDGGPPDVTGAAGPNSYLEITNDTVTLFSPKQSGAI